MDILILTHGTILDTKHGPDAAMSPLGTSRIKQSSIWVHANIKTHNYFGLTSPYYSCLETVSVFQEKNKIDFAINQTIRDYTPAENSKGICVYSRKNKFKNIHWNSFWDKEKIFFKSETKEDFEKRIISFIGKLHSDKNYLIVTHALVCKNIFSIITGEDAGTPEHSSLTYIKDKKPIWFSKLLHD